MTIDELIRILESYEVFVDDDYGGSYKSVIVYAPDKKVSRAHTPIGTLKIIDTFEEIQKENQELKKKLDELQTLYNNMFKCHCNRVQVETLLSQQKEFINYLESESKELIRDAGYHQRICLEILEKYKEIIGVKDE